MGMLVAYILGILTASKSKHQPVDYDLSDPQHRQTPSAKPLAVMCIPQTESDEERTKKKKNERRKTTKFWVEIVSAFILLGYFGATILIWSANKKAADSAEKSLGLAQNQFRMDQRPWLSPLPRPAIKVDGQTLAFWFDKDGRSEVAAVAVDLHNSGKSPAVYVTTTAMEFKIGPIEKVQEEVKAYVPNFTGYDAMIMPNTGVTPESNKKWLSQDAWARLQDGTWELYVVGGVRYQDVFAPPLAVPYETTYCYQVSPEALPFRQCPFKPPSFGNSIK